MDFQFRTNSDKDIKEIVVNPAFPSIHGGLR